MELPRAVLLDLDNTIYPYEPCHRAGLAAAHRLAGSMNDLWRDYGEFYGSYSQSRKAVKKTVGDQAAAHCRLLYFKNMVEAWRGRTDIGDAMKLHEEYWHGYFSHLEPDPGCVEMIRDLRSWGVKLAWVSNFTTERQMLKLISLGLPGAVDFLITSEEAGAEKPDPAMIDLALERLEVRSEEVWLIGDSLRDDVGAAAARGIRVVFLNREPGKDMGSSGITRQPDHVVHNWAQVRELFEGAI
jgi:putative hydrolase of the HAD superfamily